MDSCTIHLLFKLQNYRTKTMSKEPLLKSAVITRMLDLTREKKAENQDNLPENSRPIFRAFEEKSIRIAGPCALQSAEQAESLAALLKGNVDFMRAPHHKPRTRPYSPDGDLLYTGFGVENALPIYEAIKESGLPIATEIMEPNHVAILRDAISLAWTGSRNTVGPLVTQIGAAALEANGLPIMVKNPLVDHIDTFIGLIEAAIAGSEGKVPVMACLRGICPTTAEEAGEWRNVPNLDYIERLKESFPDLQIILDPSHMIHKSNPDPVGAIREILNEAMARGANGHMVEVVHKDHPSMTDPGIPVHAYLEMISSNSRL